MGDKLSDDHLKRLNDLAALRDRGVLSEKEFQRAKRRLLGVTPAAAVGRSASGFGQDRTRWILLGTGALVLILLLWLLLGRREGEQESDFGMANGAIADAAAADGEMLCASPPVHGQLKDFIFAQAIKEHRGDAAPLASLQRTIGVRMDYPLFRSASHDGGRLACSGHLILDLPPTVRQAFDGAGALEADVTYTLQPQGEGAIVTDAAGSADMVQRLVAAAVMANDAQSAKAAATIANPSFDCGGRLSNVERMICDNAELARLDRELSGRYGRLTEGLPRDALAGLEDSQRSFVESRDGCPDAACVQSAYDRQLRILRDFARDVDGSNPL